MVARRTVATPCGACRLRDQPMLEGAVPFYFEWLDHPDDGPYWHFADIEARHDKVRVPDLQFQRLARRRLRADRRDAQLRRAARRVRRRRRRARRGSLIGPVGARRARRPRRGRSATGTSASTRASTTTRWCSTGAIGTPVESIAARSAPAGAAVRHGRQSMARRARLARRRRRRGRYYLRAGGRLSTEAPAAAEAPDTLHVRSVRPGRRPALRRRASGPHDQRAIESRRDVLVYSTPPLDDDLEVIGSIECRLWIASSAVDTDFYCRLLDVEPRRHRVEPGEPDAGGPAHEVPRRASRTRSG